jgi:methionine-rich copper-binding protein CopC
MNFSAVIINLGSGNLNEGCPEITAQVIPSNGYPSTQIRGSLPPDLGLAELYRQWQLLYREYYQETRAIEIDNSGVTHFSEIEFRDLCEQLKLRFNAWLSSPSFAPIDRRLSRFLNPDQEIQIIITTDDSQLRRLPWHLWNLLTDYPYAEVVLSSLEYYGGKTPPPTRKGKVRVLAVFGEATAIDLKRDRAEIESLPGAESYFLEQPDSKQFNESLWEKQGWDILFFAGHSYTEDNKGHLHLNPHSTLSLDTFHQALTTAVSKGLKLAIFNSCDGLGLTKTLADLGLPCAIVMREAIPNPVAEEFFRQFLIAFAGGKSLHLAIREARERLEKLESCYPCASWLPVLCQPPTVITAYWEKWQGNREFWRWLTQEKPRREKALIWGIFGAVGTQAFLQLNPLELWLLLSAWKQTEEKKLAADASDDSILVVSYETPSQDNAIAQLLEQKTLNLDLIQRLANRDPDFTTSPEQLTSGTYQIEVEVVKEENHKITYSFPGVVDLTRPTITAINRISSSDRVAIEFSEGIDPNSLGKEDITLINEKATELDTSQLTIETINERTFAVENIPSESLQLSVNMKGVRDRAGNEGNLIISSNLTSQTPNSDASDSPPESPEDSSPEEKPDQQSPTSPDDKQDKQPPTSPDNKQDKEENPSPQPSPPPSEETNLITGKIEITIEQLSSENPPPSEELPGVDVDDIVTPSQHHFSAFLLLENDHFHFSVETHLLLSSDQVEEIPSFPESLTESDLANEYETVIIEERNIQQWGNSNLINETTEDNLFAVSDVFEIPEGETNLDAVFNNILAPWKDIPENGETTDTFFEYWISGKVMTRFAFNDELLSNLNEIETIIEQIYQSLNLASENIEEDFLRETIAEISDQLAVTSDQLSVTS